MTDENGIKAHAERAKSIANEIRKKKHAKAKNTGIAVKTIQTVFVIGTIALFVYIVSYIIGYGMAGGAILAGLCL